MSTDKMMEKDIKDSVIGITFFIGGYFGGFTQVTIEKTDDGAAVTIDRDIIIIDRDITKLGGNNFLTNRRWTNLVNKLYDKIHIDEWEKNYEPEHLITDGESWHLEIGLANGEKRKYGGCNAYPPNRKEFKRMFRGYCGSSLE